MPFTGRRKRIGGLLGNMDTITLARSFNSRRRVDGITKQLEAKGIRMEVKVVICHASPLWTNLKPCLVAS
jgi:hypothetical protein